VNICAVVCVVGLFSFRNVENSLGRIAITVGNAPSLSHSRQSVCVRACLLLLISTKFFGGTGIDTIAYSAVSCTPVPSVVQVLAISRLLAIFRNTINFLRCWHLAHTQSWRTTPCRLSATAYSKIFAAILHICRLFLHPHHEDAPCRGDRDPLITG
jgi:hypothetical protein